MYLFDPTPLQALLAVVLALAVGFLAAWAVTRDGGDVAREGDPDARAPEAGETEELEPRQKAIVWTAAAAILLFLLWWATLSVSSGGRPAAL